MSTPAENVKLAVDFLASWPGEQIHLTAIHPEGGIAARTFAKDVKGLASCADAISRATATGKGIYANYNDVSPALSKEHPKANEKEVTTLYAFHVDADVDKSVTDPDAFAVAKAELLRKVRTMNRPPTTIIDSGNGFGLFWMLDKPAKVGPMNRELLKGVNVALREEVIALGGDADACQNLDRVMRVPFTINYPNAAKLKRGRVTVPTGLVCDEYETFGTCYPLADFQPATVTEAPPPDASFDDMDIPDAVDLSRFDAELVELLTKGPGDKKYGDASRSDFAYSMACQLRELGATDGEIVRILTYDKLDVSATIFDAIKVSKRTPERQAFRTILDMNKRGVERIPDAPEDFAGDPVEPIAPEVVQADQERDRLTRRPGVLLVPGKLDKIVRRVQDNLMRSAAKPTTKSSDLIFQRSGELVHLSRNRLKPRKPGAVVDNQYHVHNELLIKAVTEGWMTDRAMRAMGFYKPTKAKVLDADGKDTGERTDGKPMVCDAPARVIKLLSDINTGWKFPPLLATVETPTLRPDGSILQEYGYDKASGLFFDNGGVTFPPVELYPTRDQALAALAILRDPLQDFNFIDKDGQKGLSESVQVSAMVTACVRRALPFAPSYGFSANDMGAGKTQLAQVNSIIATGQRSGERPFTTDADEQRKMLSAAFAAGDNVLLFDNVDVDLEGGPLCSVITGEEMKTRKLGGNSAEDQISASTRALMMFTGNRLTATSDMTTRVLICQLFIGKVLSDPKRKYQPLDDHLKRVRPVLVAAALTIIRAYINADSPKTTKRSRFPVWQAWGADPLVWLGLPDPCMSFDRALKADPERERFGGVLRAWLASDKPTDWRPTKNLLDFSDGIAEAVAEARGIKVDALTVRNATEYLRTMIDKTIDGYRLEERRGDAKRASMFRLIADQG
jgi:hypothetical protein